MGIAGVYREIAAPERIVHNEVFDDDWTGGATTVTSTLSEVGGRTTLTTSVIYANEQARQGALVSGMTEGMEMGYARLDALLETV
jgi:uncharacterized protein YndB with AHSA1/START domain